MFSVIACDPARNGHMGSSKDSSFNTITALGDLHTNIHGYALSRRLLDSSMVSSPNNTRKHLTDILLH